MTRRRARRRLWPWLVALGLALGAAWLFFYGRAPEPSLPVPGRPAAPREPTPAPKEMITEQERDRLRDIIEGRSDG